MNNAPEAKRGRLFAARLAINSLTYYAVFSLAPHVNPSSSTPWPAILLVVEVVAAGMGSDWIVDLIAKHWSKKQLP
jgi:hypothetical protein